MCKLSSASIAIPGLHTHKTTMQALDPLEALGVYCAPRYMFLKYIAFNP